MPAILVARPALMQLTVWPAQMGIIGGWLMVGYARVVPPGALFVIRRIIAMAVSVAIISFRATVWHVLQTAMPALTAQPARHAQQGYWFQIYVCCARNWRIRDQLGALPVLLVTILWSARNARILTFWTPMEFASNAHRSSPAQSAAATKTRQPNAKTTRAAPSRPGTIWSA